MVLISCATVVGVLKFFFSCGAPAAFLREWDAGYVTPCRVLLVVPIASFLSSVRRLEFLPFGGGTGALLQSQWECWISVHWVDKPPRASTVADCNSVEELGFQSLDRRDMILLQGGVV
jgi:hypothetical protein